MSYITIDKSNIKNEPICYAISEKCFLQLNLYFFISFFVIKVMNLYCKVSKMLKAKTM